MASTAQLDLLAKGIKEVKPVPQAFFISESAGKGDLPQILNDQPGGIVGMKRLTPEEATQYFKNFSPTKDLPNTAVNQEIIQKQYAGIQPGESVFDWMQRTDTQNNPNYYQFSDIKSFLQNPNTPSKNMVYLNGVLYDAKKAKEITDMTPEQLSAMVANDQKVLGQRQAEIAAQTSAQAAGAAGTYVPPQNIPSESFTPTDYSNTAKLSDLQKTVMDTNPSLVANDAFINGVFKAFHNRDATVQELAAYKGKKVSDVRTEIIGGAQAAGLPTVAPGTVNIPTGMLTPKEAETQGLTKVQRPDQLSAFKEDQIVRDNQGGIWLKNETTTQAQKDAVAEGLSGKQISDNLPTVKSPTASATGISETIAKPDPKSLDVLGGAKSGASAADQTNTITSVAKDYLDSVIASYDSQIASYQTKLAASQAGMDTLTGKISAMSTATPNVDALAAAKKAEGLQAKQDALMEVKRQIAQEQARLQLGMAQEQDKLAPLSIIGARQATLQSQGLARIGALTAIAQIDQDDLNFAKDMVNATVSAMNADRKEQMDALSTLITLKDKEIVRLSDEENAVVKARQTALQDAIDNAQKNADKVFDLIKGNTAAALKSGVSLADSPAVALSKMAPYMTSSDVKTQVVDLGGKKVLINSETGAPIKEFTEVKAPGTGLSEDEKYIQAFEGAASDMIQKLDKGELTWGAAWDSLHAKYPLISNEKIDQILGGSYNASTGVATGRAK